MDGIWGQWWRIGGVLGILFIIVFIVVGFGIQGETPLHNEDIDEIRAFWEDDGETYLVGDFIIGLAVFLLFLPFLGILRAFLGLAEGGAQVWSRLAFASGIIFIVIAGAAAASWTTLAFAASELDDESIRLLMYLDVGFWNAVSFPISTLLLASSVVIYRTGVVWRWLALVGVIVGIAAVISPAAIIGLSPMDDPEEEVLGIFGFISFIGLAIWLLLMSIALLMKKEEPVAATPATMV